MKPATPATAVEPRATDLRARLDEIVASIQPSLREHAIFVRLSWARRVPAIAVVDGDRLAWAIRHLVESELVRTRRGCGTMPGGHLGLRVDFGDDLRTTLAIAFWCDHVVPRATIAMMRVREIVRARGGRIEIESPAAESYKHFTRITILLPIGPTGLV